MLHKHILCMLLLFFVVDVGSIQCMDRETEKKDAKHPMAGDASSHNLTHTWWRAIENGEVQTVEDCLIKESELINLSDVQHSHRTALMIASKKGNARMVRVLIEHGANINAMDYYHQNSLFYAVRGRNSAVVQILVEHGAKVDTLNYCQQTPLMFAARKGLVEIAKVLSEHVVNIDSTDCFNHTALSLAARNGHAEMVQVLTERGANVQMWNGCPMITMLMQSTYGGRVEVIDQLIDRGCPITERDFCGRTALHHAIKCDHLEIVNRLIEHGADIHERDMRHTDQPLAYAVEKGYTDIVDRLLELGAASSCDINMVLLTAVEKGYLDIADRLIHRGANMCIRDKEGRNAYSLCFSRIQGMELTTLGMIDRMIMYGVDMHCVDQYGNTALTKYIQSCWGRKEHIECEIEGINRLIRAGINVNAPNHAGKTALMLAQDLRALTNRRRVDKIIAILSPSGVTNPSAG